MIKSLKFGSVGGGGSKYYFILCWGGAKPNISFFLGDSGNRMHFCKISLASWRRNIPPWYIHVLYLWFRLPLHLFSILFVVIFSPSTSYLLLYCNFIKSFYIISFLYARTQYVILGPSCMTPMTLLKCKTNLSARKKFECVQLLLRFRFLDYSSVSSIAILKCH